MALAEVGGRKGHCPALNPFALSLFQEPDQPRRLSQVSTGFIPNSVVIQQLYSQQQLSKESFFRRKMGLQTVRGGGL